MVLTYCIITMHGQSDIRGWCYGMCHSQTYMKWCICNDSVPSFIIECAHCVCFPFGDWDLFLWNSILPLCHCCLSKEAGLTSLTWLALTLSRQEIDITKSHPSWATALCDGQTDQIESFQKSVISQLFLPSSFYLYFLFFIFFYMAKGFSSELPGPH